MNEPTPVSSAPDGGISEKNLALIAYVLHLLGAFTLISSIAALIVNYIKRGESSEVIRSHHSWMIRTFWWALFWCFISLLLALVLVGFLIYFAVAVWWIYRHVRGLLALAEDKALPG